jgi:hypothetical protein
MAGGGRVSKMGPVENETCERIGRIGEFGGLRV